MKYLTKKQKIQEETYIFPYHYLDLVDEMYMLTNIEYLGLLKIVKELLKPYKNQLILDAGCGDGRLCYELKKEKVNLVGVDFSKRAIRFAKAFNPEVKFFVQDLEKLRISEKFDYIVFMETLEHIIPNRIPKILDNFSKVLKENGKLIITVPSSNLPLEEKHYQHFTEDRLKKTLEPYFKLEKIYGYSEIGYKRNIFLNLRRIGLLLMPFRKRLKIIIKFFKFMNNFYMKNIALTNPKNGLRLIAVFKKQE